MVKYVLTIFLIVFLPCFTSAQQLTGRVIDSVTGEPIPYVQIGVEGRNLGTISRDDGTFSLQGLADDSITFSMLGYQRLKVSPQSLSKANVVQLAPVVYSLKEVTVSADEIIELEKLGRPEITKLTIGHSGKTPWGTGGEWGLKVATNGNRYRLQEIAFHTRFNTVDSILYRVHLYELDGSLPGKKLLKNEVYVKSIKKDRWIRKNISDQNIVVLSDFIVTIEIVRLWYGTSADNQLFFTYGKDPDHQATYSRESSHAQWDIDKMPPLALFVTSRKLPQGSH